MRIYKKLVIVFLAFIIIPAIFMSCMVFYNSEYILKKEIFSKLNAIADQEAYEVETFFRERKTDLLILERCDIYKTTLPALDQFSEDRSNPSYVEAKKEIDRRFAIFVNMRGYVDIMLTNMEGRIIYVFNPEHEVEIGTVISDKDDVLQKIKITGIYIGDIHKSASNKEHRYILCLAGPAYDETGKNIGLVHMELDMGMVNEFVTGNPGLGESGEAMLVKKMPDNKVMFLSPLKYEPGSILAKTINIGTNDAVPVQKAALGESGYGLSVDYRGKAVLAAWRPIQSLGWGLVTKIDAKEAFLPIERLGSLLIVVVLAAVFSAALAAFTIAKSISEPIQKLHRGVEVISAGNLDHKVGVDTRDEIGQLSRAFDTMTESLKRKTTSIDHLDNAIAKRKKAEDELGRALEEEIKHRKIVTSMLEDNNEVRERLEKSLERLKEAQGQLIRAEKMEAIGRMASGVAHEVKNPLGIILQGINYFEGEFPPEEKGDHEMLRMMKASVKRADTIVRALLDFSRIEELKTAPEDINSIIEGSINLVRNKLKLNSIELVCELGEDLPKALIERGKIEQVFVNLFNNAADAMPKGGTLYVRSYLSELKVAKDKIGNSESDIFRLGEEAIIVEVKDTGVGIDMDIMDKIFDPFFTTKSRTEGTGLGLSIVKSIIEMHNGSIAVESKKGKGAEFTILFKIPEQGKG